MDSEPAQGSERPGCVLTREGCGPQGYFDGRQGQEVAGLHAGGGRAPKSLGVQGDHGGSGSGDGKGGAAADRLKAVVMTTCRGGTGRSAQDAPCPLETMPFHHATYEQPENKGVVTPFLGSPCPGPLSLK